jgi:serine/threonine protein kinase
MGISRVRRSLQEHANISVKDRQVLIADFGVAKDLIDKETTASSTRGGARGSLMYIALEIAHNRRRGRAVNMFSLGCIFLEISTCLIAEPSSRREIC